MLSLMPKNAHYIFTRAESRRAASVDALVELGQSLGLSCEGVDGVANAVAYAKSKLAAEDTLFIGGSTFVVAEVL